MFDQVILRPSVAKLFDEKSLRIIETDGVVELLKGRGVNASMSDHLPIMFCIDL